MGKPWDMRLMDLCEPIPTEKGGPTTEEEWEVVYGYATEPTEPMKAVQSP